MARCAQIKANEERCKVDAMAGSEWCWSHDPAHAEERRRRARKGGRAGGRGRGSSELAEIKELLATLTGRVLGEDGTAPLGTGAAAVANQLANTRLRTIEVERKMKETDDLERRIEELEATNAGKGGKRWPA
jgi:hypothetical protein